MKIDMKKKNINSLSLFSLYLKNRRRNENFIWTGANGLVSTHQTSPAKKLPTPAILTIPPPQLQGNATILPAECWCVQSFALLDCHVIESSR